MHSVARPFFLVFFFFVDIWLCSLYGVPVYNAVSLVIRMNSVVGVAFIGL